MDARGVVLLLILSAGLLLQGDAEARRRSKTKRGKVVRVERPRVGTGGALRICSVIGGGRATCIGRPPTAGDRGVLVDSSAMYGEARIATVVADADSCGNIISHSVTVESDDTNVGLLGYGVILLLDFAATSDARTLPVTGQVPIASAYQGEYVFVAVDQNRDQNADLYATYYTCDASAAVVPWGQGQVGYCVRYYVLDRMDWTLLRTDVVRSC